MKFYKLIPLALIPAVAILPACQTVKKESVIVRKMGDDTIWVKEVSDGNDKVVSYVVDATYYQNCYLGETFNPEHTISEGHTEYWITQ